MRRTVAQTFFLLAGAVALGSALGAEQSSVSARPPVPLQPLAQQARRLETALRYLGEPRQYEEGKGTAVAAEIEVGQHVLALTRAKTGVLTTMLVEIDPSKIEAKGARPSPSPEFRDAAAEIGAEKLGRLIRALALDLSGDLSGAAERPRAALQ